MFQIFALEQVGNFGSISFAYHWAYCENLTTIIFLPSSY
jgi:hypothetical protein